MERRQMLGILGAGAAGLVANTAFAQGQENEHGKHEHGEHEHSHHAGCGHEHWIMDACARVCNEVGSHCLCEAHEGEQKEKEKCKEALIRAHAAMMDCQAFCHLASELGARHSKMAVYAFRACAEACHDCEEACEKIQDEKLKRCADICRKCAEHCRHHSKEHEKHEQ